MGKPKRARSLPDNVAKAVVRNLRISPQKLNLVAGLIRGKKVAIVEKEKSFGGAGINTGTIPSKTLKESALYYSGKY